MDIIAIADGEQRHVLNLMMSNFNETSRPSLKFTIPWPEVTQTNVYNATGVSVILIDPRNAFQQKKVTKIVIKKN